MAQEMNVGLRITGQFGQVLGGLRGLREQLSTTREVFYKLGAAITAVTAGRKFTEIADEAAKLAARVRLVTKSQEEFTAVQARLFDTSQRLQTSLAATTGLFASLNPAVERLGGNYKSTLTLAEAVGASLRISGAGAQESSAAILQFAQALGSGVLQGDEFRSLAESAPRLMQAIADAIGVPRGALKQMAAEGQLTAAVVANAVIKASGDLKAEAATLPVTVEGAFTKLQNAYAKFIGDSAGANRATRTLAEGVSTLAANFDKLAAAVLTAVEVAVAAIGVRLVLAIRAATVQAGLLGAAMALVGGPAGLVAAVAVGVAALGLGLINFSKDAKTATEALRRFNDEADRRRNAPPEAATGGAEGGVLERAKADKARLERQLEELQAKPENQRRPLIIANQRARITAVQAEIDRAESGAREDAQNKRDMARRVYSRDDGPTLRQNTQAELAEIRKDLKLRVQIEEDFQKEMARVNRIYSSAIAEESDPGKKTKLMDEQAAAVGAVKKQRADALESLNKDSFDRAKAATALAKATLESQARVLQASIKEGDALIERALLDGNTDIETAYQARLSLLQQENAAQRKDLESELRSIDAALKVGGSASDRASLQERRVKVVGEMTILESSLRESTRVLTQWKSDQEKQLATITAKVRVEVAGLTGKFDREAVADQLKLQLDPEFKATSGLPEGPGKEAAANRLKLILEASLAQAEFNAKLAETQQLSARIGVQEEALRLQQQSGQISQAEYEVRLRDLRASQVPTLQAVMAELTRIRDAVPPEAAASIDAMSVAIGNVKNKAVEAKPEVVDFGTKLKTSFEDALPNLAAAALDGMESFRNALRGTLKRLASDMLSSGVQAAWKSIFSPSSGGGGGGGGGGMGWIGTLWQGAKSLFGFAEGGQIRGAGTGTSDSIPAIVDGRQPIAVSNGEFIQPERAVNHYGLGMMEAIRTLAFPKAPKFAFGGLAQAQRSARRYATGGQVQGGGASEPLQISFRLENRGTPQRVVGQQQQMTGRDVVVSVILDDIERGGPISRNLNAAR